MIEFSDFQCPFCRLFARTIFPEIVSKYVDKGKLLIVFRFMPNEIGHPLAMEGARSAHCAGEQNLFWQAHEFIFAHPEALSSAVFLREGGAIGFKPAALSACLAKADDVQIEGDLALGKSLGLIATPTFVIGPVVTTGKQLKIKAESVIVGGKSLEVFAGAIDPVLARIIHESLLPEHASAI